MTKPLEAGTRIRFKDSVSHLPPEHRGMVGVIVNYYDFGGVWHYTINIGPGLAVEDGFVRTDFKVDRWKP